MPSHRNQVRRAFFELYQLGEADVLVDLGSGDGIVLREARRMGARALGYELNPLLALVSRVWSFGDTKLQVQVRDYLLIDVLPANTTIVYAFTTSHSIEAIGTKLRQWRRAHGTRLYFISYGFTLADKKPVRHLGPMYLYVFD